MKAIPQSAAPGSRSADGRYLAELDAVTCRAGGTVLLEGVSLRIRPGEFVGVLGPNGAGKSTLLSLLNATLRPQAGSVRLLDRLPWEMAERERRVLRRRIGTVLQHSEYNPLAPLTARDVAGIGLLGGLGFRGRLSAEARERVEASLDQLGLSELAGRAYRSLSGGEQQKVQIARALAQDPQWLLLDEPTGGLDLDWQERLVELVEGLSERHALPVAMTTHSLSHLPSRCRRVLLLRRGRVLFDGPAAEALTAQRLGDLYGCRVEVVERRGRRYCLAVEGGTR